MQTIDEALEKLEKSEFRRKFCLDEKEKAYVRKNGMEKIRSHAEEFIRTRISPAL